MRAPRLVAGFYDAVGGLGLVELRAYCGPTVYGLARLDAVGRPEQPHRILTGRQPQRWRERLAALSRELPPGDRTRLVIEGEVCHVGLSAADLAARLEVGLLSS